MRTDQDLNNYGQPNLVNWATVQRAIDNYRQYITTVTAYGSTLRIYPDMDNLLVGNGGLSPASPTSSASPSCPTGSAPPRT